jgi:hypothetical protein
MKCTLISCAIVAVGVLWPEHVEQLDRVIAVIRSKTGTPDELNMALEKAQAEFSSKEEFLQVHAP